MNKLDFNKIDRKIIDIKIDKSNLKEINNTDIYNIENTRIQIKHNLKKYVSFYDNIFTKESYHKQILRYFEQQNESCYLGFKKNYNDYCPNNFYYFIYMFTFPQEILKSDIKIRNKQSYKYQIQRFKKIFTLFKNIKTKNFAINFFYIDKFIISLLYLYLFVFEKIIIFKEYIFFFNYNPIILENELFKYLDNIDDLHFSNLYINSDKLFENHKSYIKNKLMFTELQKPEYSGKEFYNFSKLFFVTAIDTKYKNTNKEIQKILFERLKKTTIHDNKITSSINKLEGNYIYNLILKYNLHKCIEVGMANGISTMYILLALDKLTKKNKNLISIDPFQDTQWNNYGLKIVKHIEMDKYHKLLKYKSYNILPKLLDKNIKINFAFIDGWHTFDYTLIDFFYCDKLLEIGGYIIIDDAMHEGVKKTIKYIDLNFIFYKKIPSPKTIACYQKIKEDDRKWNFHKHF